MTQRGTTVMVGLIAALVIPRVEQVTGVKLSTDDVAALIALAVAGWHGIATFIEHYFPPKVPFTAPLEPAGASQK